jgi:hypothetical protein
MIRLDRSPCGQGRWLGLGLSLMLTSAGAYSLAQDPKAGTPPPTSTPSEDAAKAKSEAAAKEAEEALEERFRDPKAIELLEASFPELFASVRVTTLNDAQVEAMASGSQALNAPALTQYIQAQIAQLTSHRVIEAVRGEGDAQSQAVRTLDQAGQRLVKPLNIANERNNTTFRAAFSQALVTVTPEVLKNHLYARLALMVALSRSGDPALIPTLASTLRDADQPLAVKMLAAVGLSRIAGDGSIDVVPAQGIQGSAAVAEFLKTDKPPFWPVQYRAVQAIGAIKQASSNPVDPTPDLAAVVLGYLANPDAAPQVRAWSAWSLGLLWPSPQASQYNFHLVAYYMGRAAAWIGERAALDDAKNPDQTTRLSGLLLEIVIGLDGDARRNSGLLKATHPALISQRRVIDPIATAIRAVARHSVELSLAPGQLRVPAREALRASVAELVSVLEKNTPQDMTLYSGSSDFTPKTPILPPAPPPTDELDAKVSKAVDRAKADAAKKAP